MRNPDGSKVRAPTGRQCIGAQLKAAREKRNWSVRMTAGMAHITIPQAEAVEDGRGQIETARIYAAALGAHIIVKHWRWRGVKDSYAALARETGLTEKTAARCVQALNQIGVASGVEVLSLQQVLTAYKDPRAGLYLEKKR
jgi:hypothetical protein